MLVVLRYLAALKMVTPVGTQRLGRTLPPTVAVEVVAMRLLMQQAAVVPVSLMLAGMHLGRPQEMVAMELAAQPVVQVVPLGRLVM